MFFMESLSESGYLEMYLRELDTESLQEVKEEIQQCKENDSYGFDTALELVNDEIERRSDDKKTERDILIDAITYKLNSATFEKLDFLLKFLDGFLA